VPAAAAGGSATKERAAQMQALTPKAYGNLIGGNWAESSSGETFASVNPADTSDVVGHVPRATREETLLAIEAARKAQPAWAAASPQTRSEVLDRVARLIDDKTAELARMLTREEGKTLAESTGEVKRTAANFRFYAAQAHLVAGQTMVSDEPSTFLYTLREPVGVVSVITPWNFPFAIPARKIAPALAAGNAVVFKPASLTPVLGVRLGELLTEAGLPAGVLNVLTGSASVVGAELVSNDAINAITFTGSYLVGDSIEHAAATSCRTQLEMGGKNPIIILGDADMDLAVSCTVRGAFGLTGQACTGTSRAIVLKSVADQFSEKLIQATKKLTVGHGLEQQTKIGPVADLQQEQTILEYIDIGKKEGAELVFGGRKLTGDGFDKGFFIEPAIFAGARSEMRIAREEIFGPVLAIIQVEDFDEALAVANDSEYGLSAAICTRDLRAAERFARSIQSGMVKINQPTTGVALNAPFGGVKHSSTDTFREQGPVAMEFFTRVKTVSMYYGN
jgi:acyl-CoA reductase-like NAD-dependent aldehyde dehydrogenase